MIISNSRGFSQFGPEITKEIEKAIYESGNNLTFLSLSQLFIPTSVGLLSSFLFLSEIKEVI